MFLVLFFGFCLSIDIITMERANISYSYKNIPIPDRHQYKLVLSRRIESFIKKKYEVESIFFLNTINCTEKEGREKYGLKLRNTPPHIKEIDKFEDEMIGMVKGIKFRKMRNNIQQKMYEDMRRFKESENIFVKSDKSGNLYEIEKGNISK